MWSAAAVLPLSLQSGGMAAALQTAPSFITKLTFFERVDGRSKRTGSEDRYFQEDADANRVAPNYRIEPTD